MNIFSLALLLFFCKFSQQEPISIWDLIEFRLRENSKQEQNKSRAKL